MKLISPRERVFPCCRCNRINLKFDDEQVLLASLAGDDEYPVERKCPQCGTKFDIGALLTKGATDCTGMDIYRLKWRPRAVPTKEGTAA